MLLHGWEWGIAVVAVLVAGISKGGFGSGVAFVSAAILALIIDPAAALGIMLPVLMLVDVSTLKPYWRKWHAPSARVLILGGLPGVILGAALISVVSDDVIRVLIGIVALGFPIFQLARARGWLAPRPIPFNARLGLFAGVVSGFTSFISHAGGPPMAVFMLAQDGIGKTMYQATTVIVFWAVNLMKAAVYAGLGIFTAATLLASAILAPVAVLGAWIGVKAHYAIPERAFFAVTYAALILAGIRLIWVGLN